MTKADIINEIASSTGISKKDVSAVVESFMDAIKGSLLENKENVYLRGFGSFIIKHRAEKTARNISKNTTITIPAHNFPSFKPAKTFIEDMKKIKKTIQQFKQFKVLCQNGKKKKGHKMATHKRKKRLRKNRHKSK